jgi:hypothetical protein
MHHTSASKGIITLTVPHSGKTAICLFICEIWPRLRAAHGAAAGQRTYIHSIWMQKRAARRV